MVAKGIASPERLLAAYEAAVEAKEQGVEKPGAVFMAAWTDWQPRGSEAEAAKRQEAKDQAAQRDNLTSMPIKALWYFIEVRFGQELELGDNDTIRPVATADAKPIPPHIMDVLKARKASMIDYLKEEAANVAELMAEADDDDDEALREMEAERAEADRQAKAEPEAAAKPWWQNPRPPPNRHDPGPDARRHR